MARKYRKPRPTSTLRRNYFRPTLETLEARLAPSATITVNSTLDNNVRDTVLTFRETRAVSDRNILVTDLSAAEQAQVLGTPVQGETNTIVSFQPIGK